MSIASALEPEITAISPYVSLNDKVGRLCQECLERLEAHNRNGVSAVDIIFTTLENIVRLGFALCDIRKEMNSIEGAFEFWVTDNLPVGLRQAQRYMQASRTFDRDKQYFASRDE